MPIPDRYKHAVPEMAALWSTEGNFNAQMNVWGVECEAKNELYGEPTMEELALLKGALVLTPDEVIELSIPEGHETTKLLRKVQSKVPTRLGNNFHEGNTSSDVLDTATAIQIMESLDLLEDDATALEGSFDNLALNHMKTLQVTRTHGQHAVPSVFGRQVLGWREGISRGIERFQKARDVISFGKLSGEVGTNVFIKPELEELALKKLGLKPEPAPTQIIGRDRHLEVLSLMAVNAQWLAKVFNDIKFLCGTDVGELREPFEDNKQGSSAMPHKRNPDISERIIGLSRVVSGAAFAENGAVVVLMERDISHSSTERFTLPDSFQALQYMYKLAKHVIDGLEVFPERMEENLRKGTYGGIYSSRLLNTLLAKGVGRTEAYDAMQRLGKRAIDEKIQLLELARKDDLIKKHLTDSELEEQFDPNFYLQNIEVAFKRARLIK